jgi:hypothetical protein
LRTGGSRGRSWPPPRCPTPTTAASSKTTSARPSSARAGRGAPRPASSASSTSPRYRYLPNQATWAALVAEGIQTELARFHEVLKTVQDFIATTPLDADELADIQAAREEGAASVNAWLTARRGQFAGHFTEETLNLLALGEAVPPPLPEVPLSLLARFQPMARA